MLNATSIVGLFGGATTAAQVATCVVVLLSIENRAEYLKNKKMTAGVATKY